MTATMTAITTNSSLTKLVHISPEDLHIEHCDTQRAQPTLRLHSSRIVVETCDVFVGNRTLFEVFGNIATI